MSTASCAIPVTPLTLAEIVIGPVSTPVTNPALETVLPAALEEDQVAVELTFLVVLSLYVAVATSCTVSPVKIVVELPV